MVATGVCRQREKPDPGRRIGHRFAASAALEHLGSVAPILAPIEAAVKAAVDLPAASIHLPIDSIASAIELPGATVMTFFVRTPRSAVEASIGNVTAAVETTLDTVTTVGSVYALPVGLGVLCQCGTAQNSQRQRTGRN